MLKCYSFIIDCIISAKVHVKDVVDGLNEIDKFFIYNLMANVQLKYIKNILFTDSNSI